jgi:hypothetical protein
MAAPILALALVAAYTGFTTFAQDLAFTNAQTELSFWGSDSYQPEPKTIELTGRTIDALLQNAPGHPEYLGLQANYAAWQAYWATDTIERVSFSQQAVQSQHAALQSRPAHRHSWSKMVEYASRASDGEVMLQQAQARLRALQPNEI